MDETQIEYQCFLPKASITNNLICIYIIFGRKPLHCTSSVVLDSAAFCLHIEVTAVHALLFLAMDSSFCDTILFVAFTAHKITANVTDATNLSPCRDITRTQHEHCPDSLFPIADLQFRAIEKSIQLIHQRIHYLTMHFFQRLMSNCNKARTRKKLSL